MKPFWEKYVPLLLCGAAMGWIVGMSVSPVVHLVIAAILTMIATIVSVLAGIENRPLSDTTEESVETSKATPAPLQVIHKNPINPALLVFLIFGIAIGTVLGILTRTHDVLGVNPTTFVQKWKSTGLGEKEIARRLFDQLYPSLGQVKKEENKDEEKEKEDNSLNANQAVNSHLPVLFATVSPKECIEFRSAPDSDLERLLKISQNPHVRMFVQKCKDKKCLRIAVEELLCSKNP